MERPAKRLRAGDSPFDQPIHHHQQRASSPGTDDELCFEPEQVSAQRDPGFRLAQSRVTAAGRLKSTFEHIFEKYERDFSAVGDEIDLRTGEIVVNNGHLEAMQNEKDTGSGEVDEDDGILLEDLDSEDEDDRILSGRSQATASRAIAPLKQAGALHRPGGFSSDPKLSQVAFPFSNMFSSRGPWGMSNDFVESAWKAPELPTTTSLARQFGPKPTYSRYSLPVTDGEHSIWATKPRKSPSSGTKAAAKDKSPAGRERLLLTERDDSARDGELLEERPREREEDDDEILLGARRRGEAESNRLHPLPAHVKEKMPAAPPRNKRGQPALPAPPTSGAECTTQTTSTTPILPARRGRPRKQLVATRVEKAVPAHAHEPISSISRRSGRVRRQTEFYNQPISWAQALGREPERIVLDLTQDQDREESPHPDYSLSLSGEQPDVEEGCHTPARQAEDNRLSSDAPSSVQKPKAPNMKIVVDIPARKNDGRASTRYKDAPQSLPTPPRVSSDPEKEVGAELTPLDKVIPDSQDSGEWFAPSSESTDIPAPSTSDQTAPAAIPEPTHEIAPTRTEIDPSYDFSDDEFPAAPIPVSVRAPDPEPTEECLNISNDNSPAIPTADFAEKSSKKQQRLNSGSPANLISQPSVPTSTSAASVSRPKPKQRGASRDAKWLGQEEARLRANFGGAFDGKRPASNRRASAGVARPAQRSPTVAKDDGAQEGTCADRHSPREKGATGTNCGSTMVPENRPGTSSRAPVKPKEPVHLIKPGGSQSEPERSGAVSAPQARADDRQGGRDTNRKNKRPQEQRKSPRDGTANGDEEGQQMKEIRQKPWVARARPDKRTERSHEVLAQEELSEGKKSAVGPAQGSQPLVGHITPTPPATPATQRQMPATPPPPSSRASTHRSFISIIGDNDADELTTELQGILEPTSTRSRFDGGGRGSSGRRPPSARPRMFATPTKVRGFVAEMATRDIASPARTPGGTMKICGEGGFACNREFCFTCVSC